jgi:hypothetical protein
MGDGRYIPNEYFGISDEQASGLYDVEHEEWGKRTWDHFTPEFVGTKAQEVDLEDLQGHMSSAIELYEQARLSQPEGAVYFRTADPVTVFFIGDVHYGSIYTDHDLFLGHIRQIVETPNCFAVFMSNMIDNAQPSRFPDSMLANGLTPDKQVVAIRRISEELNDRGKLLGCVTSACHEGWTSKATGQDVNALMFAFPDRHFPVLENGGRLYLNFPLQDRPCTLGKQCDEWQRLTAALYHTVGPFESSFSKTHGPKQMNRLRLQQQADIVVAAHKHTADAEVDIEGFGKYQRPVAYIRSGTYKGIKSPHDKWAIDRLAVSGQTGGQSVTISPRAGVIDSSATFECGIIKHRGALIMDKIMFGESIR